MNDVWPPLPTGLRVFHYSVMAILTYWDFSLIRTSTLGFLRILGDGGNSSATKEALNGSILNGSILWEITNYLAYIRRHLSLKRPTWTRGGLVVGFTGLTLGVGAALSTRMRLPTADTAVDDRAKVDATKYPLPLHFLSLVTVRLHAVCPLSSVKMLTNPASVVLTLSVSDDDNVVRTSSGVAQLRLADRASNPDRSEVPSESFPGQLTDSSWPWPQPKARGSARFSRPDPDLRSFPADLSARSVYWRERNGRQDIQ